jgi:hypothetical protein
MLPSGNDAAHTLAEYFGGILKKESEDRELEYRKEEAEKKKKDEERAALGIVEPEEAEKGSNSASNANLLT